MAGYLYQLQARSFPWKAQKQQISEIFKEKLSTLNPLGFLSSQLLQLCMSLLIPFIGHRLKVQTCEK